MAILNLQKGHLTLYKITWVIINLSKTVLEKKDPSVIGRRKEEKKEKKNKREENRMERMRKEQRVQHKGEERSGTKEDKF